MAVDLQRRFLHAVSTDRGLLRWRRFCATLSMHIICRQQYTPSGFAVPLMPWLPSVSIILNTFLLGTIPATAWIQFAIFVAVMVGFYALYSVHAATHADDLCVS